MSLDADLRAQLAKAQSLLVYGHVMHQGESEVRPYDPFGITENLQQTVLSYVDDPPRDENGYSKWLTILKGRQGGCSTCASLALYPRTAYISGAKTVVIADTQNRGDGMFERVQLNHSMWDKSVRATQHVDNAFRKFYFKDGGTYVVLSAQKEGVGVGLSITNLLASELPLWPDAGDTFNKMNPALINVRDNRVIKESTAQTMSAPSAEWWMEECQDAKQGRGRKVYAFFPFWDTKLCARPWPRSRRPDNDEIRLLERYGPQGLRLDNLEFRRLVIDEDKEIRRNPDLFNVFYPFDDVSCWMVAGTGVISAHVLEKHKLTATVNDAPNSPTRGPDGVYRFAPPTPGAIYIIGADAAGYGVRDHAAFQVLEVWGDQWVQVACYGDITTPEEFGALLNKVGREYNNARIAVERNGVGVGALVALKLLGYPNVVHGAPYKPGIHKSNEEAWLSYLVDALLDKLVIYGADTYLQLGTYRSDRLLERTIKAELLNPQRGKGARRERHHWDKVSALMVAVVAARGAPTRLRTRPVEAPVIRPFSEIPYNEIEAWEARNAPQRPRARKARYTPLRTRGRHK